MLDIGHTRVACRSLGSGPDVLFIHGWPLHGATFRNIAPALAEHFRCHVIDLPGAGSTELTADSPLDLGSHADSVRRVVRALGLSDYAIVAHDSGGFVARAVAADDARVLALVLGDTEIPGHQPTIIRDVQALLRLPFGGAVLRRALHLRPARRYAYRGVFADLDFLDGEFHELFVAPLLQSRDRAEATFALVRQLDTRIVDALPQLHARIHAEVLLVWGERDRIFPLPLARAMVAQFPRASLQVLANGKTFVHEEQPAAFAALALPVLMRAFERAAVRACSANAEVERNAARDHRASSDPADARVV
jgi:pimeloyl-ACP methyl ester carboxylesterase